MTDVTLRPEVTNDFFTKPEVTSDVLQKPENDVKTAAESSQSSSRESFISTSLLEMTI